MHVLGYSSTDTNEYKSVKSEKLHFYSLVLRTKGSKKKTFQMTLLYRFGPYCGGPSLKV